MSVCIQSTKVITYTPYSGSNQQTNLPPISKYTKTHTSQERIRHSIQELVDLDSLEHIQHFKYPPWKRITPYSVTISSLPKDQAAIAHNNLGPGEDIFSIYTDASAIAHESSTGIGVGFLVCRNGTTQILDKMFNIGPSQLVYNGELQGIIKAVEYASFMARKGQEFRIFSDNQAGLHRLNTPSDNPGQSCQIRCSEATELANTKGANISLHWVPGHMGVRGNEIADSLAKEAT
jgi:ribonuclease HI